MAPLLGRLLNAHAFCRIEEHAIGTKLQEPPPETTQNTQFNVDRGRTCALSWSLLLVVLNIRSTKSYVTVRARRVCIIAIPTQFKNKMATHF